MDIQSSSVASDGRLKGRTVTKPIVYGNTARYFGKRETDNHTHTWKIYLRPYYNEDASKWIRKVVFKIHESYQNQARVCEQPPYEVEETGWGEFEVQIKIYFVDQSEKPATAYHYLKLFQFPNQQVTSPKKQVVSEYYDEIIFHDPSPLMYKVLMSAERSQKTVARHETDLSARKDRTLKLIANANEQVHSEIDDFKDSLKEAQELIRKYKEEVLACGLNSKTSAIHHRKEPALDECNPPGGAAGRYGGHVGDLLGESVDLAMATEQTTAPPPLLKPEVSGTGPPLLFSEVNVDMTSSSVVLKGTPSSLPTPKCDSESYDTVDDFLNSLGFGDDTTSTDDTVPEDQPKTTPSTVVTAAAAQEHNGVGVMGNGHGGTEESVAIHADKQTIEAVTTEDVSCNSVVANDVPSTVTATEPLVENTADTVASPEKNMSHRPPSGSPRSETPENGDVGQKTINGTSQEMVVDLSAKKDTAIVEDPVISRQDSIASSSSSSSSCDSTTAAPNIDRFPLSVQMKKDDATASSSKNATNAESLNDDDDIEILEDDVPVRTRSPPLISTGDGSLVTQNNVENVSAVTRSQFLDKLFVELRKKRSPAETNRRYVDEIFRIVYEETIQRPGLVEKLLDQKQLSVPISAFLPPSKTVTMCVEFETNATFSNMLRKAFKVSPKEKTDQTRLRDKALKAEGFHAPALTKMCFDIGADLVQEATYGDIVNFKNLPERPKDMEVYRKVVEQLTPVLRELRQKNAHLRAKPSLKCVRCSFGTDSALALAHHQQHPHKYGQYGFRWQCGICTDYEDDTTTALKAHYRDVHQLEALFEEPMGKHQCPLCDTDFPLKNLLEQHLRLCKRERVSMRFRPLQPKPHDHCEFNRLLWEMSSETPLNTHASGATKNTTSTMPLLTSHGLTPGQLTEAMARGIIPISMARLQQHSAANTARLAQQIMMQGQGRAQLAPMPLHQMNPLQQQQYTGRMQQHNSRQSNTTTNRYGQQPLPIAPKTTYACEICDGNVERSAYLAHLQQAHGQLKGKRMEELQGGAPLACSRCRDRFWTYEGLERHLVMAHGLVTSDLLTKAQRKADNGRCKLCNKQYAFNLLQHLVSDHNRKLCSAEILYSCDVCQYECTSYVNLEQHLAAKHPAPPASFVPSGPLRGATDHNRGQKRPNPAVETAAKRAKQMQAAYKQQPPKKPKVKYTCTPCTLKFETYAQVIRHWQQRHLKPISIPLCRVESCAPHRLPLDQQYNIDWMFPEPPLVGRSDSDVPPSKAKDVITLE